MSTSAITGSNPVAAADTSNSSNNSKDSTKTQGTDSGLGENAFLQLLVTQLQHQDPLQPQDDTQFLAQLAQFTSLEQLTNINTSLQTLVALAGGTSSTSGDTSDSSSKSSNSTSGTTGGN